MTASHGNPYAVGVSSLDALVVADETSERHAIDLATALRRQHDVAAVLAVLRACGRRDGGVTEAFRPPGRSRSRR